MDVHSETALLLVDVQKESRYGVEGVDDAVAAAGLVVAACRTAGLPVLYTRHVNRRDGVGVSHGEVFDAEGLPVYYRAESDAVAVVDTLTPHQDDVVVDKHRWSGFHATPLDLVLRSLGVRELLVGGFTTDCCVLTSVYDAYALDYQVSLVPDMCAATSSGAHQAAVLMLANWVYGLEVVTSVEAVDKVAGRSYRSWRSSAPDQKPFTPQTLTNTYESLL